MKFKKVISIALSALIISGSFLPQTNTNWHSEPMTVLADEAIQLGTYDKITYVSYIDCAFITKVDSSISDTLTIPAEIKGLPIYGFEPSALAGCSKINKIVLPHNVQSIMEDTFSDCINLTELQILNPACWIQYGAIPSNITIYGFENSTVQEYAEEFGNEFIPLEPVDSLANGKCGDNINWSISSAGILSITGTGKMYDWTWENSSPFANGHNSFYNAIKVGNGITNIGDRAFSSSQVKNVELPDSIASIGEESFAYCMDLSNITIPESVENIENLAFCWCQSLEAITIENPDCVIYDSESTIYEAATIYGYNGSTAQAYAEKYNRNFESLDEEIITTTTTTTTKTTTTTTTTTAPVLIGPGDGASEGDKYTADGGFSESEIEASIVKPVISASKKVITLEEAKNSQQIDITISGADGKYSYTGMHIYYDPRLDIEMDRFGNPNVKIGEAGENLVSHVSIDPTAADNDCDGLVLIAAGSGNDGKDGVLWSFNVTLPDDAKEGDIYPVNIIYCSSETNEDLFMNEERDEQGKLMQAYAWTQGIYSEKYNYNFEADMDDIEMCPALKNIKRNVDGYIAIEGGEESIPTATSTTTSTTTTTTTSTTTTVTTTVTTTTSTTTTVPTTTTPPVTEPPYTLGDVNNDGTIDASDASLVLAEYAKVQTGGNPTFTESQTNSADVNKDDVIDASDASKILAYYAAISTGKDPTWD